MNDHQDKILTVLICCYNNAEFLKKCMDSLVIQGIPRPFYKVLFVDDASSDNSFEIAETYSKKSKNFQLLDNKKNRGLVDCCNLALDIIDTPYFMRLDADDYLSSNAIETALEELSLLKEENFIVFKRWDVRDGRAKEVDISNDIYTWTATGTVFSTKAVKAVGGYSNEHWEEYDLYIKLLEAGYKYRISSHRIYHYCRGHKSMTRDFQENRKGFESLLSKWSPGVLSKYGNFERVLKYYTTPAVITEKGKKCRR